MQENLFGYLPPLSMDQYKDFYRPQVITNVHFVLCVKIELISF